MTLTGEIWCVICELEFWFMFFVITILYVVSFHIEPWVYFIKIDNESIAIWSLRLRQNGRHFANDIFKYIFLTGNIWIWIKISPNFVPKGSITSIA